jgi:hypothetical protein
MQTSESIKDLAAALAKAQGEITGALKDSANPFFKSKYADLASCWDACRLPLSKNGLSVVQGMQVAEGNLYLITRLLHSTGEWISSQTPVTPKDDTPQGMGSALTYARRYALTAMVGVAQVDDDANAASGRSEGHSPKGDMGKNIHPDKAFEAAAGMRDILDSDVQDDVKCLHVADKHDILNKDADLYVAAADQLKASERKAWKDYLAMAKKRELAEPPGRRF